MPKLKWIAVCEIICKEYILVLLLCSACYTYVTGSAKTGHLGGKNEKLVFSIS